MRYRIIFTLSISLLFMMNACCHISSTRINTEIILGKWYAADSTSFRGKEIEFTPDHQVRLTLVDGSIQEGQYEMRGNSVVFSIGDAPPFIMNFKLGNDELILTFPDTGIENKYVKPNE
jgi:hypothetical protein